MNKIVSAQAPLNLTYSSVLNILLPKLTEASELQMVSAIRRLLKHVGKTKDSPIGVELLEEFNETKNTLYAVMKAEGRADATYRTIASRIRKFREEALVAIADSSLPPDFGGALSVLIQRSGINKKLLEVKFGTTVYKWSQRQSQPSARSVEKIRKLETYLKAPGALSSRLPHLIDELNRTVEIDDKDGLPKKFGLCLKKLRISRSLIQAAISRGLEERGFEIYANTISRWERLTTTPLRVERELIEGIEEILETKGPLLARYDRFVSQQDPFSFLNLTKKPYGLWNEDLEQEFKHMTWFKSSRILPHPLKRNKEGVWAREASVRMARTSFRLFSGFLVLPEDHPDPMMRGKGFSKSSLSLALLLDFELLREFCDFRRGRNKANSYNGTTVSFMGLVRNLVHPKTGYFTQHASRYLGNPRLELIMPTSIEVEVLNETEIRKLTSPESRFAALCKQTYTQCSDFLNSISEQGLVKQTRDPARRIHKILKEDQPLDVLLLLRERMENFRPSALSRTKKAVHISNIALVALLNIKPLRAGTIRSIRKHEIYRKSDRSWHANVPSERFKNWRFGGRDGWVGSIHRSVWPALDKYWDAGRSFLTFGEDSEYFWVNDKGRGFSANGISNRIVKLTKTFIPDYAPGGINSHAWRKIVAHDNFKTDRANAILVSAQQLNDLPKTIHKSYAMDNDQIRNDWVNEHTDKRLDRRKS